MKRLNTLLILMAIATMTYAQVGDHRNDLHVGVNVGYTMNRINFQPTVQQTWLNKPTFGITARYICEKYFSIIGGVQAELNIATTGWKEKIMDASGNPVMNNVSNLNEEYERHLTYLQLPVMAHLGFGREVSGCKFYINAGPQLGYLISEKTESNFNYEDVMNTAVPRATDIVQQDSMAVENKFDYGIALGLGMEYSHKKLGHFLLEARYYYGLGNIYSDAKSDYFGKSSFSIFNFKLTYLFDLIRTKGAKRK